MVTPIVKHVTTKCGVQKQQIYTQCEKFLKTK